MSLKLKRNMPLVLSLLVAVLVLTLVFGNLRVGAMNLNGGTWEELRVSSPATVSARALDLSSAADAGQLVQPVISLQQEGTP